MSPEATGLSALLESVGPAALLEISGLRELSVPLAGLATVVEMAIKAPAAAIAAAAMPEVWVAAGMLAGQVLT